MNNSAYQFCNAMRAAGLEPPDVIEPGRLYRYPGYGKSGGNTAGWCKLFADGLGGVFGDWSSGLYESWQAQREKPFSDTEREAFRRHVDEVRAQNDAEIAQEREKTAKKAAAIWRAATVAKADHPYLVRKKVSPALTIREIDAHKVKVIIGYVPKSDGVELTGRLLVVPVKQGDTLSTLELIDEHGRKAALAGRGTKAGGYWATQPLPQADGDGLTLLIGEGVATVLSAASACSHTGIAALSSGNLLAVARYMRERFPKASLVILADLVKATGEPDPDAIEAARAVGGKVAVPDFGVDRAPGDKDFNDLHVLRDAGAVRRCVEGASVLADTRPPPATLATLPANIEPEPLRALLPLADTYPVVHLGDVLGGAAKALHDSVKAPLALCCQSVLAAASLAVQAHFDIKLPWGERKPSSLFFLTVGESGERKSGVDDLVLGAAKAQQKAESEAYAVEQERYEAELIAWKQATEAAAKSATKSGKATTDDVQVAIDRCGKKPKPPIAPLRFVTDPTVEGLFKLLIVGQPSVALFSDEGGLLIGGHALNSDNALKTMARWCKLWDGSPFDRVRSGDGVGILYGRRMALHQLAQPDVMVKLLSDPMANGQGLLARCLVAWPESTIGSRHVERFEWAGERSELKRLFAVLKGLLEAKPRTGESEQELDPVELPLSVGAVSLAVAAGNQFETLMARGGDLAELRDRTSKALENACRIAAVLAVVEGGLAVRSIDVTHLQRALVLMQWYLSEALRIRGAAAVPQSVSDAELLSAWLNERGIKVFRSKQILKGGPSPLRNKSRLIPAITELESNGYIVKNDSGAEVDGVKARASWTVVHHVV